MMKNAQRKTHSAKRKKAFTYIEMVITVVVIAICFVPLIQMFSSSIGEVIYAGDKLTALNLAREEMEKFRNLNFTEVQLLSLGNMITPAKSEPPLKRNRANWRIERVLKENSDPLEVNIIVWRQAKTPQKILELATLVEDLEWTEED
ncbi:MAG: type II secretion system protein [Candidatus Omnitrophota bacterium]|nr:type II secretion system protein [Candidatus Omnitrophota bacterium]